MWGLLELGASMWDSLRGLWGAAGLGVMSEGPGAVWGCCPLLQPSPVSPGAGDVRGRGGAVQRRGVGEPGRRAEGPVQDGDGGQLRVAGVRVYAPIVPVWQPLSLPGDLSGLLFCFFAFHWDLQPSNDPLNSLSALAVGGGWQVYKGGGSKCSVCPRGEQVQ